MASRLRGVSRYAVLATVVALPLVLLVSSILTLRELEEMKAIYLRNRAATLAARLENLAPERWDDDLPEFLSTEEPALADLQVYRPGEKAADDPVLESLWSGRILFHTEEIVLNGEPFLRAYIPFHLGSGLRIARIDLEASAADFLIVHARHNLVVSSLSGVVLVLFGLYFFWSGRRTARLERRHLQLEHLAHLGKMSAVLAHEIRHPLGTIKGFAQLAGEKADEPVRKLLEPLLEETGRLEKLVRDLLLYGRPREPQIESADWGQIASTVQAHVKEAIGSRAIRFISTGDDGTIRTDSDLLVQVLLNLVSNSVEALTGKDAGEVRLVSLRLPRGGFSICVEDDGPGIPPEVEARLFQPFVTTKSNGTGLGLTIARKLTEALGGCLEIRRLHPRGTRAELLFP